MEAPTGEPMMIDVTLSTANGTELAVDYQMEDSRFFFITPKTLRFRRPDG